jgi:creatinine amidohydrolase/Fe(II)-dependent formamide hydrolase-like protein
MQDYNPAGAVGNAAAATAEKGQALLEAAGRALAQLLAKLKTGLHATGEAFEEICHGLPLILV